MSQHLKTNRICLIALIGIILQSVTAYAQTDTFQTINPESAASGTKQILSSEQQTLVEDAIARALDWLAANHQADGSFPTLPSGQPGVTSLSVMAFLSAGHTLQGGPNSQKLHKAVSYTLNCQQPTGYLAVVKPASTVVPHKGSHTIFYNHGISGLMLSEVYGMTDKQQSKKIRTSITNAIEVMKTPPFPKRSAEDRGGWRYFNVYTTSDSDTTCTAWQLMFLRSSKNAGFDVPEKLIDEAVGYLQRSYDEEQEAFTYGLFEPGRFVSAGSVGGAIVSLSMAGKHNTRIARHAGQWLMQQPLEAYNTKLGRGGHYIYGVYYGSQAAYQLGGEYWRNIYPRIVKVLLKNQLPNGSWPADNGIAKCYGSTYTTAMAVLALTPEYQLLPIYQR